MLSSIQNPKQTKQTKQEVCVCAGGGGGGGYEAANVFSITVTVSARIILFHSSW
jgi:hypothetical protein